MFADEETAQFIEYNGVYYRDSWLRAIGDGEIDYTEISIVRIYDDEYESLKEQFDNGEMPVDTSLEEEIVVVDPVNSVEEEVITVKKTAAQILEEQIKLAARFAEV